MTAPSAPPDYEVAIVGTGFGGLCAAIELLERGETRIVLLERAASVGGTWRDNHYPGAACDVPSHLYSLSFEPNPDWSRTYPTQPELKAYLEGVAERRGVLPYVRFGCALVEAAWDEAGRRWTVVTSTGTFTARVVISASGGLAEPKRPDIPGIERFRGKTWHSARWDHGWDMAGKRVAVIGTGASAVQFVPEIAAKAARLDVYQRTPSWIVPRPDQPYSATAKWVFRHVPGARFGYRAQIYWRHELRVLGFVTHPALMRLFQRVAVRHVARQVRDRDLRARVTPDYTIGCKRILMSNDWYPALQKPGVALITTPIREITEGAVVTTDGEVRHTDALVFATGFYATENPIAARFRGRGGQTLAEAWKDGEEAHVGTTVKGFPNLFLVVGPNTGLGHTSMVFMIEAQVAHILRLLAHLRTSGAESIEVTAAAHDAYNRALQARLAGSVWATGCKSWYQHRSGKITALWPGFTFGFWLRARRFSASDYALDGQVPRG